MSKECQVSQPSKCFLLSVNWKGTDAAVWSCMKIMLPTRIHRNPATAQLCSKWKQVLLSWVKGMPLSLGGGPGPCFQDSCKDHPQSNRSEHCIVQCFLMGTQSDFLWAVQGSPSARSKPRCALGREGKGPDSGVSSIQWSIFHPKYAWLFTASRKHCKG